MLVVTYWTLSCLRVRAFVLLLSAAQVVDFTWAFKANTQGQYQGNGQFLNHVTTVVADVYAAWGFHVSVKAHADEPYNAGTLGAPVAVQELQVCPFVRPFAARVQPYCCFPASPLNCPSIVLSPSIAFTAVLHGPP